MISQSEANRLLDILKSIIESGNYEFPNTGKDDKLHLVSNNEKYEFIIDVNRKSKVKTNKCTYQKRYKNDIILLRLDINGPDHTNPDGEVINGSHLHIYKEGFNDSWAYPLPPDLIIVENELSDTNYLIDILISFLKYCKVVNIEDISIQRRLF